jgi:putative membrane protein
MKPANYLPALALLVFAGCHMGNSDSQGGDSAATHNRDTTITTTDSSNGVQNSTVLSPDKKDTTALNSKEARWLKDAYQGGLFEVELGKIAQNNAGDPKVREFGTMMVQDHSQGGAELTTLAASKGVTLPDSVSDSQKRTRGRLFGKVNADFDKDYVGAMVDDHKSDIKDFEEESVNGTDPAVKAFAEKMLKTLHTHLDHAQALQKTIH